MGEVFEPKDVAKRRKVIHRGLSDLSPALAEMAREILVEYRGDEQKARLVKLLGEVKARELLKDEEE